MRGDVGMTHPALADAGALSDYRAFRTPFLDPASRPSLRWDF